MKKLMILATLIIIGGCGSKGGSDDSSPIASDNATVAAPNSVVGTWDSGCQKGYAYTEDFKADGSVTRYSYSYGYDDCSDVSSIWKLNASYLAADGKIDFTYNTVSLQLKTQDLVDAFNKDQVYGISDWQVGQVRDVTGLKDLSGNRFPTFTANKKHYQIFEFKDGKYFLGDNFSNPKYDGSTPEKRPFTYDVSTPYSKK